MAWGLCLILRRVDESIVGASTRKRKGANDATVGEVLGLNTVVAMARNLPISKIIFELDVQAIVNVVKSKKVPISNRGFIVRRCIEFLKENPNASLS
jgi:hypothetical protein